MRSHKQTRRVANGSAGRLSLGYDIVVFGRHHDFSREVTWKTPAGRIRTVDPDVAFGAFVDGASIDSIASVVSGFSRARMTNPADWDKRLAASGVHPGKVSWFLLRKLVTEAAARSAGSPIVQGAFESRWLLSACEALMDMGAKRDAARRAGRDEKWAMALRMLQQQYHDQLEHGFYLMELDLALKTVHECAKRGLDIDSKYRQRFGLTYHEFAALSFAALATLIGDDSSGLIDPNTWSSSGTFRVSPSAVSSFFDVVSLDSEGLGKVIRSRKAEAGESEWFAESALFSYPLLKRSDGLLVAPVVRDVMERPTRGFAGEVRAMLDETESGKFALISGGVFESDAKEALRASVGPERVLDGAKVLPVTKKNCDVVVDDGPVLTLCEIKGVRFRPKLDLWKTDVVLREELTRKNGVAHGLLQLNESARAVRNGETKYSPNRTLAGLLVVRGEQVALNGIEVRAILEDWVHAESGFRVILKYQIVNDLAFERLVRSAAAGLSIGRYIQDKNSSAVRKQAEVWRDLSDHALSGPHPFEESRHKALQNLVDTFVARPLIA